MALVTGAADGIGLACAKAFSDEGAFVIMADIDRDKNTVAAKGLNAVAVHCDVRRTEDVKQVVSTAIASYKKIDILVNNAAI